MGKPVNVIRGNEIRANEQDSFPFLIYIAPGNLDSLKKGEVGY